MKKHTLNSSEKLSNEFYLRSDVVEISRELLGKFLVTNFNNELTSGMISEVEAYNGAIDKASHAYNNRRTKRNEIMYSGGGVAYVYLCYGIHHLFNVVTNETDIPHAILVRAIKPIDGIDIMVKRRKQPLAYKNFSNGPGSVSVSLGINTLHSGTSLNGNLIWIENRGITVNKSDIISVPRIGVEYAKEDALLPYRFRLNEQFSKQLIHE